jgi:hypothetical protein
MFKIDVFYWFPVTAEVLKNYHTLSSHAKHIPAHVNPQYNVKAAFGQRRSVRLKCG